MGSFWPELASPESPLVILVQDAHGLYSAQKSLAAIVKNVAASAPEGAAPLLIAVEGAAGAVDVEPLRLVPDPARRTAIAEGLLQAGRLTGEEMAVALEEVDAELVGMEDPALHAANLRSREETRLSRENTLSHVLDLLRRIEGLKERLYPPAFKTADDRAVAFERNGGDLEAHVRTLSEAVGAGSSAFPQSRAFLQVCAMEKRVSPERLQKEVSDLLAGNALSAEDASGLTALAAGAGKDGAGALAFYDRLARLDGHPIPAAKDMADLLRLRASLDPARLADELPRLEASAARALLRRAPEDARTLRALDAFFRTENRVLALQATPYDWALHRKSSEQWPSWEAAEAVLQGLEERSRMSPRLQARLPKATLHRAQAAAEAFYRLALRRNNALTENALAMARRRGADRLVMVAGGFHTPGLTRALRRAGASYVVVSPQFSLPDTLRETSRWQDPEGRRANLALISGGLSDDPASKADWLDRISPEDRDLLPANDNDGEIPGLSFFRTKTVFVRRHARVILVVAASFLFYAAAFYFFPHDPTFQFLGGVPLIFLAKKKRAVRRERRAFDEYASSDEDIQAAAGKLIGILGDANALEEKSRELAKQDPLLPDIARRLAEIRMDLAQGKASSAENRFHRVQAFSEGRAARLFNLLDEDERSKLYSGMKDPDTTLGRMGFRDYWIRRHLSDLKKLIEGNKELLDAENPPSAVRVQEICKLQSAVLETIHTQIEDILALPEMSLPRMKDEKKNELLKEMGLLMERIQIAHALRQDGNPDLSAKGPLREELGEWMLPRFELFAHPETYVPLSESRLRIDLFTRPLTWDKLNRIHEGLLAGDNTDEGAGAVMDAVKLIKQARRRFPRGMPESQNELPAPTVDLTVQAFRHASLGWKDDFLEKFPEHQASLENVRAGLVAGSAAAAAFSAEDVAGGAAAVVLSAEELKEPYGRYLARRLLQDPMLSDQSLLAVDLTRTFQQAGNRERALERVARLVRAAEKRRRTVLVVDFNAGLTAADVDRILDPWVKRHPGRPGLVALSSEMTRRTVLERSEAYRILFGDASSQVGADDLATFHEAAANLLRTARFADCAPEILEDFYKRTRLWMPVDTLSSAMRLFEDLLTRRQAARLEDPLLPAALSQEDVAAFWNSLPRTEDLPFQQRLWRLQEEMREAVAKIADPRAKETEEKRFSDVAKKIQASLDRFNEATDDEDRSKEHRYLYFMLNYPWTREDRGIRKQLDGLTGDDRREKINEIKKALRARLLRRHYGMEKPIDRLVSIVGEWLDIDSAVGPFLLLVGPPGGGKTTLTLDLAEVLKYFVGTISFASLSDSSIIEGTENYYGNAGPSRITEFRLKNGAKNMLLLADEIDKILRDMGSNKGNPEAYLLQMTEPKARKKVREAYLDVAVDYETVFIMGTANYPEKISPPLRDRAQEIEIPGYSPKQKMVIAERITLPNLLKKMRLSPGQLGLSTPTGIPWSDYLEPSDRGVRQLNHLVLRVVAAVVLETLLGKRPLNETPEDLIFRLMGPPLESGHRWANRPGESMGIGPAGHPMMIFASAREPGPPQLDLDGPWGETNAHAARLAAARLQSGLKDWAPALAPTLQLDAREAAQRKLVLQLLEAPPEEKDDSSNGVTHLISGVGGFLDLLPGLEKLATCGELDARGHLIPVKIEGRLPAALTLGAKSFLMPFDNAPDLWRELAADASLRGIALLWGPDGKRRLFLPFFTAESSASKENADWIRKWNMSLIRDISLVQPVRNLGVLVSEEKVEDIVGLSAEELLTVPPQDTMTYYLLSTDDQVVHTVFAQAPAVQEEDSQPIGKTPPPPLVAEAWHVPSEPNLTVLPAALSGLEPGLESQEKILVSPVRESILFETGKGTMKLEEIENEAEFSAQWSRIREIVAGLREADETDRSAMEENLELLLSRMFRKNRWNAGRAFHALSNGKKEAVTDRDFIFRTISPATAGLWLAGLREYRHDVYVRAYTPALPVFRKLETVLKSKNRLNLRTLPQVDEHRKTVLKTIDGSISSLKSLAAGLKTRALDNEIAALAALHQNLSEAGEDIDKIFEALRDVQKVVNKMMFSMNAVINPGAAPKDTDVQQNFEREMLGMMSSYRHSLMERMNTPGDAAHFSAAWQAYESVLAADKAVSDRWLEDVPSPLSRPRSAFGPSFNHVLQKAYREFRRFQFKDLSPVMTFISDSRAIKKHLPLEMASRLGSDPACPLAWQNRRIFPVNLSDLPSGQPDTALKRLSDLMENLSPMGEESILFVNLDELSEKLTSRTDGGSRGDRMNTLVARRRKNAPGLRLVFTASPETHAVYLQESSEYAALMNSPWTIMLRDSSALLDMESPVRPTSTENWTGALTYLRKQVSAHGLHLDAASKALEKAVGRARLTGRDTISEEDVVPFLSTDSPLTLSQLEEYRLKIQRIPEANRSDALYLLGRLALTGVASEETRHDRHRLETLLSIPYGKSTPSPTLTLGASPDWAEVLAVAKPYLEEAQAILDEELIGLEEEKEQMMLIIAICALHELLTGERMGFVAHFTGGAGTGKTQGSEALFRAMRRVSSLISVGQTANAEVFLGLEPHWRNSGPGIVTKELIKAGVIDAGFTMDEIDKIGHEASAPFLSMFDPGQNGTFGDNYAKTVPLDRVGFIATSNVKANIQEAVRDRFQFEIVFNAYADHEKVSIAIIKILPELMKAKHLGPDRVMFPDLGGLMRFVVERYTNEPGMRKLSGKLSQLLEKARDESGETGRPVRLDIDKAIEYLGEPAIQDTIRGEPQLGEALGASWSEDTGQVHRMQAVLIPGGAPAAGLTFSIAGKVKPVMKGSFNRSFTYAKNWAIKNLSLTAERVRGFQLMAYITPGNLTKDGASAAVPLAVAIASCLSQLTGRVLLVRPEVAMTGIITDSGVIHPIHGLSSKILAAARAGATTFILPRRNKSDLLRFLVRSKARELYGIVEENGFQTFRIPALPAIKAHRNAPAMRALLKDSYRRRRIIRRVLRSDNPFGVHVPQWTILHALRPARPFMSYSPRLPVAEPEIELKAPRDVMEAWLKRHPEIKVPMTYVLADHMDEVMDRVLVEAPPVPTETPSSPKNRPIRHLGETGSTFVESVVTLGVGGPLMAGLLTGRYLLPILSFAVMSGIVFLARKLSPRGFNRAAFETARFLAFARMILAMAFTPAAAVAAEDVSPEASLKILAADPVGAPLRPLLEAGMKGGDASIDALRRDVLQTPVPAEAEAKDARFRLLAWADARLGLSVSRLFDALSRPAGPNADGRALVFDQTALESPWLKDELSKRAAAFSEASEGTRPILACVFDNPALSEGEAREILADILGPLASHVRPVLAETLQRESVMNANGGISLPRFASWLGQRAGRANLLLGVLTDPAGAKRWLGEALMVTLTHGDEEVTLTASESRLFEKAVRAVHSPEEAEGILAGLRDGKGLIRLPAHKLDSLTRVNEHAVFAIQA